MSDQDKSKIFDHLEWANKEVKLRGDKVHKLRSGVSYHRKEEIEDQVIIVRCDSISRFGV